MSSSESEFDGDSGNSDTDEELQRAFQRKELLPGVFQLVPQKERIRINNIAGMQDKLKEFQLNLPWIEKLDTINEAAPLAPELAHQMEIEKTDAGYVENEFKREVQFYRQAQAAVMESLPKLQVIGVKTKRPADYFAQMAKSDEHMQKVREVLLNKQTVMERKEKLKKLREMKKYGKQVQQEVLQKRREEKKEMMGSVQKFRKSQKNKSDANDQTEAKPNSNKKAVNKAGAGGKQKKKVQSKKQYKDKKFGFGGQKKKSKFNDKESSNDVFGGNSKKKGGRPSMGNKKGGFQNKGSQNKGFQNKSSQSKGFQNKGFQNKNKSNKGRRKTRK